jgi:hypothetical protein
MGISERGFDGLGCMSSHTVEDVLVRAHGEGR